ncbi:hypothetical protein [Corynebacterium gottingense]|uniref:Uncharacterized protein n=1 Tax=Corynebacterium gottingense TaxID=2041036 RepID=A0ABX9UGW3_9CORY|nr:hypothetical protein [Corynebacterium gottingense]RMD17092.1 hypothetical protein EAW56_11360 [Corynebacterium gottingense]WJZ11985.1 hypothetical protein CGOTT_00035 [Corynebacterium gottingense]WJZ14307.1 hypothetical protein CGOTTB_00040 [Corynebacterium gottingense]
MRKRSLAALTAAALAIAVPAPAHAGVSELSSGSSTSSSGSSKIPEGKVPADGPQVPEQPPLGSAYTGSAPISLTIAALATFVSVQLLIDAIPPLRQAVDQVANQAGLSHVYGSSEGNRIFDVPAWIKAAEDAGYSLPQLPQL